MKVQIIGLPGAGKTTGINKFVGGHNGPLTLLDLRNFSGTCREQQFQHAIIRAQRNTIAESACGIGRTRTFIIHLKPPIEDVYERLLARDKTLDEDYLSLLSTQILPAHATITQPDDIPDLLKLLLEE